ncbi:MAG: PIN domain-containing protein [Verrucomicrobia bacterium]|nr:PIN domain-containing protein [Verrucomicrobiota bacterium]MCH8526366.1 PIN domain-containing protein [Kiritimatiellia bacterium]
MILDTNAISALQGNDKKLIAKLCSQVDLMLNLISLGEYRYGIDGSRHRDELSAWLDALTRRAKVLTPDLKTLPFYSQIRHELKTAGTPIPANDVWIAAICRQHKLPILSRDAHFDKIKGLKRITW